MRHLLRHLKSHPRQGVLVLSAVLALAAVTLWPHAARADAIENGVVTVMNWIFQTITYILGNLLVVFIDILVFVAQYNDFINAPAVQTGWAVTRDMANMFFIVALLLISIGTVFRIQEYRYTSLLRRLIIMAILINFSKTIAAFFIDLSQVVMLTFVNAFKDLAAGNLTQGFGIDKIVSFSQNASAAGGDISLLSVAGAMFAAVIMLFVALVVVAIFTILLAQRIVMLWIYVVLAPTAYMVAVLPGSLGSWWSSWWRDFSQYLTRGPVIAFFLWLALTIISLSNHTLLNVNSTQPRQSVNALGANANVNPQSQAAFASEATTPASIINYIIAIGLLIAGLQQATKASGAAGAVAGKWMGNINRWGGNLATAPLRGAGAVAGFGARRAGDLVKPAAYRVGEGALGLASRINVLGIGAAARKQQASLRQQRLRAEDKDTASAKYLDRAGESQIMLGSPQTLSGRGYQKAVMENAMKTHGLRGYSPEQKLGILSAYEQHIGYSKIPRPGEPGKFDDTAVDSDGLKVRKDLFKKSPGLLAVRASASTDAVEKAFYEDKMRETVKGMSTGELNDMEASDWKNDAWAKVALPELDKRLAKTKFRDKYDQDVNQSMQEAIDQARVRTGLPATAVSDQETLAQEDIDRQRQERTARRIRESEQRGQNFHESEEYRKNPSQYYDNQSFTSNLAQQERRVEREKLRKYGVLLPVTGASAFGNKASNTLAVGEDVLKGSDIRTTAGGNVADPEAKRKLASALTTKLTQDIGDIEKQMATATPEALNSIQEGSATTVRDALQAQKQDLEKVRARLANPDELNSLSFVNADRHGGSARNIVAEEGFHRTLQDMDANGSFRQELWSTLSPSEQQQIVEQMRAKTGDTGMDERRSFEEYLAKGLTNLTRETWADTSEDAVKLKSGLALAVQAQAEKQGVKMWKLDMMTPKAAQKPGVSALETKVQQERKPQPRVTTPTAVSQPGRGPETVEARSTATVTNVTQNIQNAFKTAPPEIRGKLTAITADALDSALKNSIVWRGLMSYIKNNAAELEKSEQMSDLGRKELQKRMNSMEKHVQEGNADEFKSEFNDLQNIFSGGSSEV